MRTKELQLSDGPATKPSEESTNQTAQCEAQAPTVTSFNDPVNPPHEYEVVDQHFDNHMNQSTEYEKVDMQDENREQVNSEYATIPDIERPYDLPLTGYTSLATTAGEYTHLTHTYENQQAVPQSGTQAVN